MKTELETLITPVVKDLGYELWGYEYLTQGKYSLLRIYIDKAEGIGVEDCERVSREISAMLDVEDPISGNYNLEISSPGMPRPLFYLWQYQRYLGQPVQLKLSKPVNGQKKWTGVLKDVAEGAISIETEQEVQVIDFYNIAKAHLTV